jgi:hypothetical protein
MFQRILHHGIVPFLIIIIMSFPLHAQNYRSGIRLGWDYRSQRFITGGAYGRLKLLADHRQAFVYDAGGVCMIRFKDPKGTSFKSAITVASPPSGSSYTNAELLELQDGTLMYAYNERVSGMGMKIKVIEQDPAYTATFVLPDLASEEVDMEELDKAAGGISFALVLTICGAALPADPTHDICEADICGVRL